jgi:LPS-assembly protein
MAALPLVMIALLLATLAGPLRAAGESVQLTPSRSLQKTGKIGPDPAGPTHVEADRIEGQTGAYLEAQGNVIITNPREQVHADWVHYAQAQDEIEATGAVSLQRGEGRIEGTRLHLKVTERLGEFKDIRYQFRRDDLTGRGQADALHFQGRDRYQLDEATYTTCPAGNDDWVLRTGELELDYLKNLGTARDTRLEFLGTPILYAPWVDFSLDNARKTGLLAPITGVSDERGFELAAPWYWNIAPNRDATIIPRLMTRRGLQVGGEFRYLEENYRGEVAFEILPNDRVVDETRYHGLLRHQHRFSANLSGSLVLEEVSDDTYFTDLSSLVNETSRVHLPREAALNYNGGWWNALARVQTYQTLEDPKDPTLVEPLYQRVPQLLVSASRRDGLAGLPLQLDFAGEGVRFEHDLTSKSAGNRVYAYPSVSLPLQTSYGYVKPKLGWHYTYYDLDRNDVDATTLSDTRSLPIASLDTALLMDRDFAWNGRSYIQTLEPRAYYLYIPYQNQDSLPVFDTALADLSLAQLFAENQYVGQDRINDANQLTLAVTSRFLDPRSGLERLQLTLGQRYYFNDQRVTLPGSAPRGGDVTDFLAQVSGQLTDQLRLSGGIQYNPDDGELARANAGAHYQPGPGRVVNLDLRYINDRYTTDQDEGINQIDLSWQWPLQARWYSVGRVNYSFKEERLVEGLLGFEYNAGCWSLRAVAQQLATASDQSSSAFYLQLELRGLTRLGVNPLDVLSRSISGYSKSDEIQ